MNKHVQMEVSAPHFGQSRIDRLMHRIDADTRELDALLNSYSFSDHWAKKLNAHYVWRRLSGLTERWQKIDGKANGS